MANHFEAIGFEVEDEEGIVRLEEMVVGAGETRPLPDGGTQLIWRGESGAAITLHLDPEGRLLCATPSFASNSVLEVRASSYAEDHECSFCVRLLVDLLNEDGELVYPLATQLADVPRARAELAAGRPAQLAPALFAEGFELWPNVDAFESRHADEPQLAARSLVPTGLFVQESGGRGFLRRRKPTPPDAQVLMTGVVEAVELRRNELSGRPFMWLRTSSYGADYEVVASAESERPVPGNVIQGRFWVVSSLPT